MRVKSALKAACEQKEEIGCQEDVMQKGFRRTDRLG